MAVGWCRQQAPVYAGGTDKMTRFGVQRVQQSIFVGHVIVVAGKYMGGVIGLQPDKGRNVVTVEVEDVVNRHALLHHKLNAIEVIEKRLACIPPCDLRIEMCTGKIFLAGKTGGSGAGGELMPHEPVHAFRHCHVEAGLEVGCQAFGPGLADGGFAFLRDETPAVDVTRAGGLLCKEAFFILAAMRVLRPELCLRDGGTAESFKRVKRSSMRAAALSLHAQSG